MSSIKRIKLAVAGLHLVAEHGDKPFQAIDFNLPDQQIHFHAFEHIEKIEAALDRLATPLLRFLEGLQRDQRLQVVEHHAMAQS